MSTNMEETYDVVVIGAGPGGYPAGVRAGQLGLRTAVIEKADLGGICLNWGCIPTKALLHGAELVRAAKEGPRFGISMGTPQVDIDKLVKHSRGVSKQLTGGVGALLQGNGVDIIRGTAEIVDKGEIEVSLPGGKVQRIHTEHIIVATGASPRVLPGLEPDGKNVWTYKEALVPEEIPESLVVIGSGAIGSEFACLYGDLGSKVTLLEAAPRFMPNEPEAISETVAGQFKKRGIKVEAGARVSSAKTVGDGAEISWTSADGTEHTETVSKVLVAAGVVPNSKGLGLEKFDVIGKGGFITTDSLGKSAAWGLYAIGDVAGGPCLAHKATHEGVRCVDAIAGVRRVQEDPDWRDWVPRCTYTTPEVASIGISAQQAKERGIKAKASTVALAENGRALGAGETVGFAQITVSEDGEVLGAHLVGHGVTELIGMVAVGHTGGVDAETFARTMLPHPTRSEVVVEALLKNLGRPINSL
ncbi:dihydrolipoyl dehydrogenase [Micrococcus sp.]|uniref:dihydrolipoyl dehydrogenase n=1 Tax=Micrococcus sp. TaxID=1271 RepID=UPI002A90E29B|nr:dihydrolipoyl dehydrogenase [Micrococcus sp.]MDY6054611.1 dihydrolipoyl dehydrogenase [Micrococcus sp.]